MVCSELIVFRFFVEWLFGLEKNEKMIFSVLDCGRRNEELRGFFTRCIDVKTAERKKTTCELRKSRSKFISQETVRVGAIGVPKLHVLTFDTILI